MITVNGIELRYPKVYTIISSETPTPNANTTNIFTVTALVGGGGGPAATFGAPTGSPINGQKLTIRIKDDGNAGSLGWNAIYRAGSDIALPTTTVVSKTIYCNFIYNATDVKWDLMTVIGGI